MVESSKTNDKNYGRFLYGLEPTMYSFAWKQEILKNKIDKVFLQYLSNVNSESIPCLLHIWAYLSRRYLLKQILLKITDKLDPLFLIVFIFIPD